MFLPVAFITLDDFHELAFAVLPLGFALYWLERGRRLWFVLCLAVTFLVKDELPLVGLGFGLYILLEKRDVRLGLGVLAGSALAFFAIIRLIIPAFGNGSYVYFASRYGQLGNDPGQMLVTIVTQPRKLVQTLAQGEKLKYLLGIFGPILFLPLVSGFAVILVAPTLAYLLLSNYRPQFAFTTQYSAPLIALVLGTAILGMARLPTTWQRPAAVAVLISSLIFAFGFGDLPLARNFNPALFRDEPRYVAFAHNLSLVPPGASVAAENNLTPHLSERRFVYDLEFVPIQNANADYVALDDAAFAHDARRFDEQVAAFESRGYQLIASGRGLALLKRP